MKVFCAWDVSSQEKISWRYSKRCKGRTFRLRSSAGPGALTTVIMENASAVVAHELHSLISAGPEELRQLYRAASVHACVSWYETPGLVSLEAALSGCKLVVTPGGSTREYFGEDAFYCRPDDAASIRAAVVQALGLRLPTDRLAARVAEGIQLGRRGARDPAGVRTCPGGHARPDYLLALVPYTTGF